jgi:ATP-binding cassette subfamily B protein RaxB
MFRHLLSLPVDFFSKRHVGDIQSRFMSMEEIRDTLTTDFIEGVVDGLMMIITLIVMYIYSPMLTLVVICSLTLYFICKKVTFRSLKRRLDENIVNRAKEDSLFLESVRGIIPLKNFGKESKRQSVWMNAYTNALNSHVKVAKFEITYSTIFELLSGIEQIIIVWVAAHLIISESFTVGMLLAYIAYRQRLSDHARSLIDKLFQLKLMSVHVQRISDILLTAPEPDYEGHGFSTIKHQEINIRNLSFQYASNEESVLKNVNFTVEQGESVCIVGSSGCGKSTLLKLLLGLLKPSTGQIELDGQSIHKSGLRNYREKIAVVMQDDNLFSGSIRDNITMFDPNPDDAIIKKCTVAASIFNDINSMPMGFSSLVGDMGSSLSGGQKQRLLIARALYAEPDILFLDEATSHLDMITERKVNKAIKKLGITTIMVAHRKETIDLADRIINLAEINEA